MKNIFKSRIFAFIFGAVIFSGITGVAAYSMFAKDIKYTPKDTTWKKANGEAITNVEEAIDELYNKNNNILFGAASSDYSAGITIPDRNVTKTLSKGKYIVSVAYSLGAQWSTGTNSFKENTTITSSCSTESDCVIEKLRNVAISQKSDQNNNYVALNHGMYYIEVLSDTTTLKYVYNANQTKSDHVTILNVEVSKIN